MLLPGEILYTQCSGGARFVIPIKPGVIDCKIFRLEILHVFIVCGFEGCIAKRIA